MTREETIRITVKSLLEVVQTGAKNIDITVMDGYGKVAVRPHVFPCSNLFFADVDLIRTWILNKLKLLSRKSNGRRKPVSLLPS